MNKNLRVTPASETNSYSKSKSISKASSRKHDIVNIEEISYTALFCVGNIKARIPVLFPLCKGYAFKSELPIKSASHVVNMIENCGIVS